MRVNVTFSTETEQIFLRQFKAVTNGRRRILRVGA